MTRAGAYVAVTCIKIQRVLRGAQLETKLISKMQRENCLCVWEGPTQH